MNIEKGKISEFQLLTLIIGLVEGSILLVYFITVYAKNNAWLVILAAMGAIFPFVYGYARLAKQFPGVNFAQMNFILYGRFMGTMISLGYLAYFGFILALNINDVGGFYTNFIMNNTPSVIFVVFFTFACGYAVWNGIEVLARVTLVIVAFVSFITIMNTFLLLPKMDLSNLLPIGAIPLSDFIHAGQIIAEIPFGEIVLFLPVAFAVNSTKHLVRTFLLGLFSVAVIFLMIAIRNTAVLGNTEAILVSPSFQVTRLISFGFLSRLDIFFAVAHTMAVFIKCSVIFYATVVLSAQLCGLKTYQPLIFPVGCIAIIVGLILYPSQTAHVQSAQNVEIFLFVPFIFLIPPLSLFIAKLRHLPKSR